MLTYPKHPCKAFMCIHTCTFILASVPSVMNNHCRNQHLGHTVMLVFKRERIENIRKAAGINQNISLRVDPNKAYFPWELLQVSPALSSSQLYTYMLPEQTPQRKGTVCACWTHLPQTHLPTVLLPPITCTLATLSIPSTRRTFN